jgi:hypothetical protein
LLPLCLNLVPFSCDLCGERGEPPADYTLRYHRRAHDHGGSFMVTDMTMMSTGMMVGMVIYHLIIVTFALLGIAAFIKYLRS